MPAASPRVLRASLISAARISIAFAAFGASSSTVRGQDTQFEVAIRAAQDRVVKLFGGRIGETEGYGSGVLVSADGAIITDLSVLSETPGVRVVTPDGRSFDARLLCRDEWRQLALLKIDVGDEALPYFDLDTSGDISPGEWLVAAGNPFKVAVGPEPVTVSLGVLSARAPLSARRKTQDFAYDGDVLITDAIVAAPGFAGGALVGLDGALVGIVGKAVTSKNTNTYINFAYPAQAARALVDAAKRGETRIGAREAEPGAAAAPLTPFDIGVVLFDIGGRAPPAFVERVAPDSPARRAGVRSGDLVLSLDDTATGSCDDLRAALARQERGRTIMLTIKRGEDVVAIEVVTPAAPGDQQ
ncbi:MAG: trypsin-like peptidase domain-containing protein [Phycisphaerales bacterium]|nr:trypsin-like peptidase domain-containing protein [Phycisphaerales bacterium]